MSVCLSVISNIITSELVEKLKSMNTKMRDESVKTLQVSQAFTGESGIFRSI